MWTFTTDGFYSTVQHRDDANTLIVRCRAELDALKLRDWMRSIGVLTAKVRHTPEADYEWRLFVPRHAFGMYLAEAVGAIDYGNFKQAVYDRQGPKRARIYGEVWATMLDLQHPLD